MLAGRREHDLMNIEGAAKRRAFDAEDHVFGGADGPVALAASADPAVGLVLLDPNESHRGSAGSPRPR
jgi:hypothetical protein